MITQFFPRLTLASLCFELTGKRTLLKSGTSKLVLTVIVFDLLLRLVETNLCKVMQQNINFSFFFSARCKTKLTNCHFVWTSSTSSPGPSPRSKWRSENPLAKAAEILQESWSTLSRDT